jgi:hypothetical protein
MSKHPPVPIKSWHRAATVVFLLGGMAAAGYLMPEGARADDAQGAAAPLGPHAAGDASSALPASATPETDRGAKPQESRPLDIRSILAPLMSSPDHRRLAAKVDALIRQNATDQARLVLAEAIQAGTFAALMIDQLEAPDLLAFLDTVEDPKVAPPDPDSRDARIHELEAALTHEKNRADAAQSELAERGADLVTLEAQMDSKAAALRAAEARMQDQAAAATRDREALQSELERLRHDHAQRLSAESARADAAQTERDELRQRLASLRGADARIADLSDALAAEQTRAETATQSLMEQRRAGESLQTRLSATLAALGQERARADAASGEADRLRKRFDGAEQAARRSEQTEAALRSETERATRLAGEVDELRKRLDAAGLAARRSEQAEAALRSETERAAALAGEVDQLRKRLDAAGLAAKRSEQAEAALRSETERAAALAGETRQLRDELARAQGDAASGAQAKIALGRERQNRAAAAAELEQLKREKSELAEKIARLETLSEELTKEKQRADELAGELTALRVSTAKVERTETGADVTGAVADALQPESNPASGKLRVRLPAFLGTFRDGTMQLTTPDHAAEGDEQASAAALPPERGTASKNERIRKLVERAEGLLKTRDIASARLLLERAARSGDGRANYLLAQSYDPAVLAQWQVVGGVSGDEAKAKAYYAAARASGYQ